MGGCAPSRLPKVWCDDLLWLDAVVTKESIGSLELGIVECLGKARPRLLGQSLCEQSKTAIQPLVTEIGLA